MLCQSFFVLLFFFFWPLCCLFFFDVWILITSLWYLLFLLLDGCLFFFFWPLCCLFFFDIRILITPLVSSTSRWLFVLCLLAIVLSVLLRYTVSNCPLVSSDSSYMLFSICYSSTIVLCCLKQDKGTVMVVII